jgi:tetratricopeptide (TPR) repeat protein
MEGKWEESSRAFQKALEIEPENRPVRLKYAYSLGALGRYNEALDIYNKLKEESPDNSKIYSDLGVVYTSMGNLSLARENLKKAVDLDPSPETYLSYSAILERVGDIQEAIRYLKLYLASTKEGDTPRKLNAQKALSVWERKIR